MEVLQNASPNYGILYPLQTFSKTKQVDFCSIPICIESYSASTLKQIKVLAESLSDNVQEINFEKRKTLHLAAVFVCNFTNHMNHIASELMEAEGLPFDLVVPLIKETTNKLDELTPAEAQTGPAIRNDQNVLKKHMEALKGNEDYQNIYKLLTESIQHKKISMAQQIFKQQLNKVKAFVFDEPLRQKFGFA